MALRHHWKLVAVNANLLSLEFSGTGCSPEEPTSWSRERFHTDGGPYRELKVKLIPDLKGSPRQPTGRHGTRTDRPVFPQFLHGSAWGPVILPVFKTGGRHP